MHKQTKRYVKITNVQPNIYRELGCCSWLLAEILWLWTSLHPCSSSEFEIEMSVFVYKRQRCVMHWQPVHTVYLSSVASCEFSSQWTELQSTYPTMFQTPLLHSVSDLLWIPSKHWGNKIHHFRTKLYLRKSLSTLIIYQSVINCDVMDYPAFCAKSQKNWNTM